MFPVHHQGTHSYILEEPGYGKPKDELNPEVFHPAEKRVNQSPSGWECKSDEKRRHYMDHFDHVDQCTV